MNENKYFALSCQLDGYLTAHMLHHFLSVQKRKIDFCILTAKVYTMTNSILYTLVPSKYTMEISI